jgi:hypothetical protein
MGMGLLLAAAATASAETVYLDELDVRAMSAGWGESQARRSVDGNALQLGGETFERGVGTHAVSQMVLERRGATRFQAMVGVDGEVGETGTVEFSVRGGEQVLWSSGVVSGGAAPVPVDVELGAHERITLQVGDGGDGIGYDHANWADARFTVDGEPPRPVAPPRPADAPEFPILPPQTPTSPLALYNGRDLDTWYADLPSGAPKEAVWTIRDGILYCTGTPGGHLISDTAWKDYRLEVEWRWPPGSEGGNNGVLVHTTELRVLGRHFPRSIEVQLASRNAGDFWVIGEDIRVPDMDTRREGRHIWNLNDDAEKPIGEWNHMVIHAKGDTLTVWVNDQLVNQGTDASVSGGRITLQSEGAPCQFRRVEIMPLPEE